MSIVAAGYHHRHNDNDGIDFDKKEWIRDLKQLKKEYILEDRERTRPFVTLKRELKDFIEECEKEEKKAEISLKKEQALLMQFIEK